MSSDQEKAIAKEHPRTISLPQGYAEFPRGSQNPHTFRPDQGRSFRPSGTHLAVLGYWTTDSGPAEE